MAHNHSAVIGLDIGSAKTTVCAGNFGHAGQIEIYNVAMVKTRGVERGIITNLGELAGCIEEVMRKTESKLKNTEGSHKKEIKIQSVYATIGGEHVLGNNTKGMLTISSCPAEITRKDTQRVIESAKYLSASIDREILHALSQEFIVDGHKRIKDPLGMYGTRLGVNLHILSCGSSFATNVVKAVNRAGLDVDGIVYSGFATSYATLTEQEKQAGVILLEFGAGTINILFFSEGSLQYTSVIPMGGQDITMEIYRRFGVDVAQAEALKMQYKSFSANDDSAAGAGDDKIIIKKDAANYESITRSELTAIVDKKLNELLSQVKKDIELAGILTRASSGIVVCGGMSFMDGIIEKIEDLMHVPVNLGIMRGFISSFSGLSNIFYATGIGVVMYGLQELARYRKPAFAPAGVFGQVVSRLRTVYDEYF